MRIDNPTVKWSESDDCWLYSVDNGKTWNTLSSDNIDASYEAIEEAEEITNIACHEWDIQETEE